MNCEYCLTLIDDYVDGALPDADRRQLEAHLVDCPACRVVAEDVGAIRRTARSLEEHVPPARVWTKLSAALETEHRQRRSWNPRAWNLEPGTWNWRFAALAATLLLVVGTSWIAWRQLSVATPAREPAPAATAAADPELVQSVETELRLAEEHYQRAIAGLEQITRTGSDALDPQVASVLQKNIEVIDHAIGESRAALQTQPTSEIARESLFEALRNKVALLQDTVVLINEMRKGNQEGAARIVSGINQ